MERRKIEDHIRSLEKRIDYLNEKINELEASKVQDINLTVTIKENDANEK